MRIGLISYEYPPQQGLGGVGTYMFRLAGALGMAGHEVHVVAGPSTYTSIEQPNVHLHRIAAHHELRSPSRALRWIYWQGIARLLSWVHPAIWHWIKWDLASYAAIEKLHAEFPLDLVEVPEHAANGWMAGCIHRWPIVMRMHCPWDLFVRINRFPYNPMHRLLSTLERRAARYYPDCVTVPSRAMRDEIIDTWPLRRVPEIIPNFMDIPEHPAPLPPDDEIQRIVCVGRVEPLKGQDTLATAFAMIAHKFPKAVLSIVGPDRWPGKDRFADLLPRLVPDPAIQARIELPGPVPLEKVPGVLRQSRIAVIASRGFESFSYSALEALAAARPTVASSTGALPELIENEKTGLIVPPSDPVLLAMALERLLADRALSERLSLAAHTRAREKYDTPAVLPQILAAYEDASNFFYQCKAAGSERTAAQWRLAQHSARKHRTNGEALDFLPEKPKTRGVRFG